LHENWIGDKPFEMSQSDKLALKNFAARRVVEKSHQNAIHGIISKQQDPNNDGKTQQPQLSLRIETLPYALELSCSPPVDMMQQHLQSLLGWQSVAGQAGFLSPACPCPDE
jgi:hypothetical protein